MTNVEFLKTPISKVESSNLISYRDLRYIHHNKKSRSQRNASLTLASLGAKIEMIAKHPEVYDHEDAIYLAQEAQKHLHNFPKTLVTYNKEGNPEFFVSWETLISTDFFPVEEHRNNQEFIINKLLTDWNKLTVGECFDILFEATKCNLTTKKENGKLKKFQSNFERSIEDWKGVYNKAEVSYINLFSLDNKFFERYELLDLQKQEDVKSRIEHLCKRKQVKDFIKSNEIKHPLENIK